MHFPESKKVKSGKIWKNDNYINQIAGIRKSQIDRFKKENIITVEDLCKINLDNPNLKKINSKTLSNLKIKAELVQKKRESGKSDYKIIETQTCYIVFTNEPDALNMDKEDERYFVIKNENEKK